MTKSLFASLPALLVCLISTVSCESPPSTIRIGAIFTDPDKDSPVELAFKYAIYKINKSPHILPNVTLVYDIQYVPPEDSFRTTKKVF